MVPYGQDPPFLGAVETKEEHFGEGLAWEGLGDSKATKGTAQVYDVSECPGVCQGSQDLGL